MLGPDPLLRLTCSAASRPGSAAAIKAGSDAHRRCHRPSGDVSVRPSKYLAVSLPLAGPQQMKQPRHPQKVRALLASQQRRACTGAGGRRSRRVFARALRADDIVRVATNGDIVTIHFTAKDTEGRVSGTQQSSAYHAGIRVLPALSSRTMHADTRPSLSVHSSSLQLEAAAGARRRQTLHKQQTRELHTQLRGNRACPSP